MPVKAEQVDALRAYLGGDFEDYQRRLADLDSRGLSADMPALLAGAFFEAVDRRFPKNDPQAEVILFVAGVRERYLKNPDEIDPTIAERIILGALGVGTVDDVGVSDKVAAQFILLYPLVAELGLDTEGMDVFLEETRELADELLGG